jgi:hypothetical protein
MDIINATGDCESCYLDGAYFAPVLRDFHVATPDTPIVMNVEHDEKGNVLRYEFADADKPVVQDRLNFIRIVIHSESIRHSTLMIVDPRLGTCSWWNPRDSHPTDFSRRLHSQLKTFVFEMMRRSGFTPYEISVDGIEHGSAPRCQEYGYCTAYVLKYVISNVLGLHFNPSNIKGFVREIERRYEKEGERDVEYDFTPAFTSSNSSAFVGSIVGSNALDHNDGAAPALVGAGLGGLAGGLVAGPVGLVAGGLAGGLVGAGLSSAHDKQEGVPSKKIVCNWRPTYSPKHHCHYSESC